jgi:asparagine synthase (glutamine-hydrolysing)
MSSRSGATSLSAGPPCHQMPATPENPLSVPIDPTTACAAADDVGKTICAGNPRFRDRDLANVAAELGPLAAWSRAFERYGELAPVHVDGNFAVAFQDSSGRTFLAVDRFAIHPLCYRVDGGSIAFSQRADDLAGPSPQLDTQALFDYLYFHVIPAPRTVFDGVNRLPAGHGLVFQSGRADIGPWWVPSFDDHRHESFGTLREEFLRLLRESITSQLDGSEVGCFLSGGTDSSTIAGMLGEVTGVPARTFSIGFDAEGYDEMQYARIAARHFHTDHHEYYITPDDLVRGIPQVAAYYDQPFGNSSALAAYYCAQNGKSAGVQRMLAGDGGDELFGGNTRYAKQQVFGWYDAIPGGLKSVIEPALCGWAGPRRIPLLRKAASYVEQARVPMPARLQTYNLLQRLGLDEVLTPAMRARTDAGAPLLQQGEVWRRPRTDSLVNRMLAFDWKYTLADNDLPKVCGTTAMAGIVPGFPLLDDRLVDFSLRLDPNYKLRRLKLRWFFKEALRGFLPDAILVKKKHGFGVPFGVWTTRHSGLRALAEQSLHSLADRNVVRASFIDALLVRHLPEHPGYYGEMVWILMMLEQWLQVHSPDWRLA